jgi:T-complex protein 1 subunit delta
MLCTIFSIYYNRDQAVANAVRTSLGPRGMDKLIQLADGSTVISNDGATILSKINVLHPAAKMLVELSQSQDIQAGDGTTTVTILAGALLDACGTLLSKGIHPVQIATSFLSAANKACEFLSSTDFCHPILLSDRDQLLDAVKTCLSSKVVAQNSDLLAPIAVDSVLGLVDPAELAKATIDTGIISSKTKSNVDLRDIRIVEQVGGTIDDSELVHGLVLQKGSNKSAGGPTSMKNAKIALIQYCLSAPKTDMDNTVIVQDYAAMDRILREERKYILQQCKTIKKSGANVVLIQKSILRDAYNELSLHFLAKMDVLVVTDIERTDVDFICRTLGCTPVAQGEQMTADKLGTAELVTDIFMEGGSNKVVKFTGCGGASIATTEGKIGIDNRPTMTVLLRGSNEYVLSEASRSLHDAQCVVRSLVQQRALTPGGGACETYVAYKLNQYAVSLQGKDAYCFKAFAAAMEVIPYTLAENAGMKPIDVVTELRTKHATGLVKAGIYIPKSCVIDDIMSKQVVQPLLVSTSAIQLATETVAMIMKIDDVIVVR